MSRNYGKEYARFAVILAVATLVSLAYAAAAASGEAQARIPLGLPPVPIPDDNLLTPASVALGEKLFFETGLSVDHTISCASCHMPDHYFADVIPLSKGVGGQSGDRNASSILNAAYAPHLLWDGRSVTLEDQVRYPVTHPREMNNTREGVVRFLERDPLYVFLFKQAFGDETISWDRVAKAIASFERTLLSGNSAFDRYVLGDGSAISSSAKRGFELFRGKAGCINCHKYTQKSPFFSDFEFHNTGVGWGESRDLGRYEISKMREDKGAFRTPSLRNVAETGPYMHNGRLASLEDVIKFYSLGGVKNPLLDERIKPLNLSDSDEADLIAFLKSLTGDVTFKQHTGLDARSIEYDEK